jgi:hypothetical protein
MNTNKKLLNKMKGGEEKMKKTILILVLLVAVTALFSTAYADDYSTNQPATIAATANIKGGSPEMSVVLYRAKNGDWKKLEAAPKSDQTLAPVMMFDKWDLDQVNKDAPEQWISVDQYVAFVYTRGMGAPYKVTTEATGSFKAGNKELPQGAFAFAAVHAEGDKYDPDPNAPTQGSKPELARIENGVMKRIIGVAKIDGYASDPNGRKRILQFWYGFPPLKLSADGKTSSPPYAGYEALTTDKVAKGNYSGVNVKITIEPAA